MALTFAEAQQLFRMGRLQEILNDVLRQPEHRPLSAEHKALHADVLQRTGRVEQARAVAQATLQGSISAVVRARCDMALALTTRDDGNLDQAVRLLHQAQRHATEAGDRTLTGMCALLALRINSERCAPNVISSMLSDVRRLVTSAGDPHLTAFLHETVARHETQASRFAEARRHLRIATELLETFPNAWIEQYCALNAFCLEFYCRNMTAARQHLERAAALSPVTGSLEHAIANNRGHLLMQLGQHTEAEAVLTGVIHASVGEPLQSAIEGVAKLFLILGRLDDCERELDRLRTLMQRSGMKTSFPFRASLITRIRLLLVRGEWQYADRAAVTAIQHSGATSETTTAAIAWFLRALALSRQGRTVESARAICKASELGVWSIPEYHGVLEDGVKDLADPVGPTSAQQSVVGNGRALVTSLARTFDLAFNHTELCDELNKVAAAIDAPALLTSSRRAAAAERTELSSLRLGANESTVQLSYSMPQDPAQALGLGGLIRVMRAAIELERYRQEERDRAALWPADSIELNGGSIFLADEMRALLAAGQRVASTNVPILITGETGTGKEVLARAIHGMSNRSKAPFLPFNCTSTPRDMLDSQLFGHRRGAFTGATEHFPGVIRSAAGGTLFLDEIGDMSLEVQPKLLRFLEAGEVHPIGETQPRPVDVRVIAATNVPLEALVSAGRFRDDLFYRLNIIHLHIPPLRERRVEIPAVAHHYLQKYAREFRKGDLRLSEDTMEYVVLYRWPGNVRQLANEMRRMAALAEPGAVLMPEHLSTEIAASRRTIPTSQRPLDLTEVVVRLDQPLTAAIQHVERAMLQYALKKTGGRMEETASILGVSRKGLYLKRQRFGIEPPRDGKIEVA